MMQNNQTERTKSSSGVAGNRSFLHRNADSKFEGLALKRKTLPLQLIPNDIVVSIENGMQHSANVPITTTFSDSSKPFNFKESLCENELTDERKSVDGNSANEEEISEKDDTQDLNDKQMSSEKSPDDDKCTGRDVEIIIEEATETVKINEVHNNADIHNSNNKLAPGGINFKVKPKWAFTRNVMMHYVPNKTKRSKKLANKSRVRKVERPKGDASSVISVSQPTNFVYLAGTARWAWLNDATFNSQAVITHEEKFARLSMVGNEIESNQVQLDDKKPISSEPRANESFLWSNSAKCSIQMTPVENNNYDENYDDVGILSSISAASHEDADDVYDDVGPPIASDPTISAAIDYDDEQVYDDVIWPINLSMTKCSDMQLQNGFYSRKEEEEEPDLIYMQNDYSSVDEGEEDADDEDTLYDDVGINCQSRVNSLYASTQVESEWEDLDEILPQSNQVTLTKNNEEITCAQARKKTGRWSRKVRRQRSKTLRKNSSRSNINSQTARIPPPLIQSVAVSLGTGSVLLVGSSQSSAEAVNASREESCNVITTSTTATQLRILDRADADSVDTQETSCYVLEGLVDNHDTNNNTASDDSNYETLCSEPCESINGGENIIDPVRHEAPVRPVPPPPRESNLTGTFGKRMKILKRTWSITKGSLGRMRRRTSTTNDVDTSSNGVYETTPCENCRSDARKLSQGFNFKKHFQRTVSSSHSTFYLDNENHTDKAKNNNGTIDDFYGAIGDCWRIDAQSIEKTSQTYSSDDYNMLAEEPLYQFYAAATVRGAFHSDSDSNYGEDDSNSSLSLASTADLARPGHRSLWCETPQIKNSDLLEKLSADDKKLQEAKFEIVTSEASYLNSLRVLVNEFLINHELVYEVLSANDREKIFGKVPGVLIASEKFLGELESTWRQDAMLNGLANVLLKHAERCSQIYIDYCSNQVSIDATLKELKGRKSKFADAVTRIEAHPACQSLSLHSFLMLPMQRVTRLPLLADAVLSKLSTDHEERLDWERVVSQLGKVVTECNEAARAAGRQIEMETLSRKLVYSAKVTPIDLRERYLVRSGPVTQMLAKPGSEYVLTFRKKYHKNALYLLLLTDFILVAKHKTNAGQEDTYTVIDTAKRSLVELEKVPDDSPFAGRHAMILTLLENHNGRHVEYILSCQNATERERWLDAVSPPKPNLVGETLYETWDCPQVMALYSYSPSQPDELTLQPGDVINVLRKMADGWNHGEKLVGGQQGWFPGNFVKEVASEHVRARNLRQRHRLLALSESLVQQRANYSRFQ